MMLECWCHNPNYRPKFKDLKQKLRDIQPIQVQAIANSRKSQDGRRCNFLEYKVGQVITVLGKENFTKCVMWYGVLPGGTCGLFDPDQTKLYVKPERVLPGTMSPHPSRNSAILRSDVKRHTYTGKRTIQRKMISSPQGDVKHTGHVGVDGAYFGDISFLDPAGCPPRQVVTPYKPSEDLEQVPLLNPNSPSHLTGAICMPPYPILKAAFSDIRNRDEVDLSYNDKKLRSPKKYNLKTFSDTYTSKGILNKVKSASRGLSLKNEDILPVCINPGDEVHEYHEISDTGTDGTAAEMTKGDSVIPDSPGIPKSCTDFGQSLLDEMEYMFRNLDTRKKDYSMAKHYDIDNAMSLVKPYTLSKSEKKKLSNTGTMKLMSAHDEKTLDTAVALANEITTKSMNDQRVPCSPNDRSKFPFKFPLGSTHQSSTHDTDAAGKHERRNFSEEAKSVPDIQSTITAESKHAYTSLIEDPMPSSSLISHMEVSYKPATIPKPAPRFKETRANFLSLQKQLSHSSQPSSRATVEQQFCFNYNQNELPLPPRNTKPKLIDKPRHIRKYPLKLPDATTQTATKTVNTDQNGQFVIYQNALTCSMKERNGEKEKAYLQKIKDNGVDVYDGPSKVNVDTNPFTNSKERCPNPFNNPIQETTVSEAVCTCDQIAEQEKSLVKDSVSVEDLLEFADQKPCGRQRGVESDEVRIMNKVLKQQTTPEECLEALELSDWNVHQAIKVIMVKMTSGIPDITLEDCCQGLVNSAGDIVKASAALVMIQDRAIKSYITFGDQCH